MITFRNKKWCLFVGRNTKCLFEDVDLEKVLKFQTNFRNKSKYHGVYKYEFGWIAKIFFEARLKVIGRFKNEIDAAKAHDHQLKRLVNKGLLKNNRLKNLNFK